MKTLPVGSVYVILCRNYAAYYLFMNIVLLKTYSLNTNATGCNRSLNSRNRFQIKKKVQWAYSQKTLYITFLIKISNFFPIEAQRVKYIIHTQTQRVCFMHVPKMMLEIHRTHLLEINSAAIYLIVNINSLHIFSWSNDIRKSWLFKIYIYDFYEFKILQNEQI